MIIDINDLMPGSEHFKWREFLACPRWGVHVFPTKLQYENLLTTVLVAEAVREVINKPMVITSGLRPIAYNALIRGAKKSLHMTGEAFDFHAKGMSANTVKFVLRSHLMDLDIRMENMPGAEWTHIDTGAPGITGRFFNP